MSNRTNRAGILPLLLGVVLVLLLVGTASAAVWTDKDDYQPGEVVTISGDNSNGAGYLAGETVFVDVLGPNGYIGACSAVADDQGAWNCQVTLWEDESAVGGYSYTASGETSGVLESGAFTDGVCSLDTYEEFLLTMPEPGWGVIGELVNVSARAQNRTRYEETYNRCFFGGCTPCNYHRTYYSPWYGVVGENIAFNLGSESVSAITDDQGWASADFLVTSDSTWLSAFWDGELKERSFGPVTGDIPDNSPPAAACNAMWQKPDGGMVGYWTFDNAEHLAADVFGLQDGTVYGSPNRDVGMSGGALDLDGDNDFIDLGTGKTLTDWPAYSLSIWFRYMYRGEVGTQGYGQKIISKADFYRDLHLEIGTENASGRLHVWTHYNPLSPHTKGTSLSLLDERNFMDGAWHHAVVTKDADWGELWVDGVMMDSGPIHSPDTADKRLYLGYTPHSDGYQRRYFGGTIDEFAIFDRALAQDEIQLLHALGDGGNSACPNQPPTTVDDAYSVNEDQTLQVGVQGVLTNDSDPDGNQLTAALVSSVGNGTLTFHGDGSFTYSPSADYFGPDSFTYVASDGTAESNEAAVFIEVVPVNDAPTFVSGPDQEVLEDAGPQTVPGWATAISAGPTNEAGQSLIFIVSNNNNSLFSVQPAVAVDGTLVYASAPDASGTAQITVHLQDDGGTADGGVNTSAAHAAAITVRADTDGDGWADGEDNAPLIYNPDQSDLDGDSIADVIDPCPNNAANTCDPDGSAATYVDPSEEAALSAPDGTVSITLPPGAVAEAGSVSVTDTDGGSGFELTTNKGKVLGVSSIDLQPSPQTFNQPVSITFAWADEDNDGFVDGTNNAKEDNLIVVKDGTVLTGKCKDEPADDGLPPDCDKVANTFRIEVTSWSEFALVYASDPQVTDILVPSSPVNFDDQPLEISGNFTDADDDDSHTAEWDWGDGLTSTGVVGQLTNTVEGSHTYAEAGVYTVVLTVLDSFPNSGSMTSEFLVIFDPNGGFVTGGGWFDSPEGAFRPQPSLTGKASFGFVSKYKKGASMPTGNSEFQFKTADLNFHSDSYEWLVVNGNNTAMFKGEGTINGEPDPNNSPFLFRIWAGDGAPDTFRIRIWYEEGDTEIDVYDNGTDQALSGGAIVVHQR